MVRRRESFVRLGEAVARVRLAKKSRRGTFDLLKFVISELKDKLNQYLEQRGTKFECSRGDKKSS
jgi:molybdopterin synthase catalytic subunit